MSEKILKNYKEIVMFGFPEIEHEVYKNNFLKSVIFKVGFDKPIDCKEEFDSIKNIFKEDFPRIDKNISKEIKISFNQSEKEPTLQHIDNGDGIEMKSANGQQVIAINGTSLSFIISGSVYHSIDDIISVEDKLIELFKKYDISNLNKLVLRKLNILEFKVHESPISVLSYLLTPELMNNLNYFPMQENIRQNIQTINYNIEDKLLNLRYGLNVLPSPNEGIGQILIDIELVDSSNTSLGDFSSQIRAVNHEIFKVFNWAVSENMKNLLNE